MLFFKLVAPFPQAKLNDIIAKTKMLIPVGDGVFKFCVTERDELVLHSM